MREPSSAGVRSSPITVLENSERAPPSSGSSHSMRCAACAIAAPMRAAGSGDDSPTRRNFSIVARISPTRSGPTTKAYRKLTAVSWIERQ